MTRSRRFPSEFCPSLLIGALLLAAAPLPAAADPTLAWSTYLGGRRVDVGSAVAAWHGTTYVAGTTKSADYPVFMVNSSKPWDDEFYSDAFVTALNSSGAPLYSTYVPLGENNEIVTGIGVDADGSAYVVGTAFYGGDRTVVIAKLKPWGDLDWIREAYGRIDSEHMAVDAQGNVYVTGYNNNPDENYNYMNKTFVWKVGPDGTTHYWLDFERMDYDIRGIGGDSSGNAYLIGRTELANLPKANQQAPAGANAFVIKLDPAGSLLWSTYLGGSGDDGASEIEVAADNSLLVLGSTSSADFPTLNALQATMNGSSDLFLVRLRPWGARLSSTYLGGDGAEEAYDLEAEPSGIHLLVSSPAGDSPLRGPLDPACTGRFVAKLDATASQVLDAACLDSFDLPGMNVQDIAVSSTGVSLTGPAGPELPVENAWQPSPGGEGDAFAARIELNNAPDCSAAVASPAALWPADGRFISVFVRDVTDPDGEAATLSLTSIHQDEWLTVAGMPDATGLGTSRARLRSYRLNGGDGRVYHLRFTATDPHGESCMGLVKVCVPPTQGGACIDGGARVDSTRAW